MIKNNSLNRVALSLGVAFTLVFGFSISAQAQSGSDNQGYQSNEKDNGVYGDSPSGLNPLDIMHRAQQIRGRSATEFSEESQLQISNSASDFKRLQQQRILEQQQSQKSGVEAVETAE